MPLVMAEPVPVVEFRKVEESAGLGTGESALFCNLRYVSGVTSEVTGYADYYLGASNR